MYPITYMKKKRYDNYYNCVSPKSAFSSSTKKPYFYFLAHVYHKHNIMCVIAYKGNKINKGVVITITG